MTRVQRVRRVVEGLAWMGLVGFLGWRMGPQVAAAFGVASANAAAPPFQLTTLDSTLVSDHTLRGRVVLVDFWATWCPPCRVEMPGFQQTYDRLHERGFVVLGVAMDAGGSEIRNELNGIFASFTPKGDVDRGRPLLD